LVVGLHDVDLRAPLAADHVGVTVVGRLATTVVAAAESAGSVMRRARDEVKGEVAPTTDLAEVHVEADGLAQ